MRGGLSVIPATSVVDRDTSALVLIDIQERLAASMSRRDAVSRRAVLLAHAAAIVGVPIVVTRQYPRGLGSTVSRIGEVLMRLSPQARVIEVDKMSFDCFRSADFCDAIAQVGRSQLILAGMETHICVTQTALAGLREGFDVHVAGDACCSRDDEHHALALMRLGNAGCALSSSESASYELVGVAGTPEFKSFLAVVKDM